MKRLIVSHRLSLGHCGALKDCVFPQTQVSLKLLSPFAVWGLWAEGLHYSFFRTFSDFLFFLISLNWIAPGLTAPFIPTVQGSDATRRMNWCSKMSVLPPSDVFLNLTFLFLMFNWFTPQNCTHVLEYHNVPRYLWYSNTWVYCIAFKFD